MRVIAVDTSSEHASVALVESGEVRGEVRLTTVTPSVVVLSAVDFLLRSSRLAVADVDGFAVTLGPGSFTGVRVGLSTVQGLGLGSGRPSVGLSTLDVLAFRLAGEADRLVAMVDAFRDEVFVGVYDRDARPLRPPFRGRPDAVLAELPPECVLTGDGVKRYERVIREGLPNARIARRSPYLAAALGCLAEPSFAAGRAVSPAELRPLYLRDAGIRASKP